MKPVRRKPSQTSLLYQRSAAEIDEKMAQWNRLSLFQRRVLLRQIGMPRSLYKYRAIPLPADKEGRSRLEDFLLHNRLWLSTVDAFNDPFEGQADYRVPYQGEELRSRLEHKYRELGFSSQAAKAKVSSADVADPGRLETRARVGNERVLKTLGVAALATNASSPLLWAHYADKHQGICVQLRPAVDLGALMAHPVEYNEVYPLVHNMLAPATDREMLPIMRKSPDWAYEQEWRIVGLNQPNTYRPFRPPAMSAVILGMRMTDADKAYVQELMDERQRRYGMRPTIYQAVAAQRRYRVEIRQLR